MTFFESLIVGLICMTVVFLVLAVLFALILILSRVLASAFRKSKSAQEEQAAVQNNAVQVTQSQAAAARDPQINASVNGLKLNGVDERTAAMIMAVVSHETKTPLNELVIKSISLAK